MHLTWTTSVSAGILHAASALLEGRVLVDHTLAKAIEAPARDLAAALDLTGLSPAFLWRQVLPLTAASQSLDFASSGRQLVVRALARVGQTPPPAAVDRLVGALAALEAAFMAARPRVADELPLRCGPLRSQWEARGPGLLAGVVRLTSPDWLVPSADVVLVPPVLGGAGRAFPNDRLVIFEAVLANPIHRLPEVLRLGWLLAQLKTESTREAPLALVAVVLASAEEVELASGDLAHFEQALAAWYADATAAETLWQWWQGYSRSRPGWLTGLEALARSIG